MAVDPPYFGKPDFVVIGWPQVGGEDSDCVWVVGSSDMTCAELEAIYDNGEFLMDYLTYVPPRLNRIELRAEMKSYVMCRGRTYAEAFQNLMDYGAPDEWRERKGIGQETSRSRGISHHYAISPPVLRDEGAGTVDGGQDPPALGGPTASP